jgi:hypothetical protein
MFKELRERAMKVLGMVPRQRARLHHLRNESEVEGLVELLCGSTLLPPAQLAAEIETLRVLPQSSLYLQIQHAKPEPFEVQLLPAHDGRLSLRLTVESRRLEWGYTFPGDIASASASAADADGDAVDEPEPPVLVHPEVIAMSITGGQEPRYTVKVPPSITHATIVARDRVVSSAIPLVGVTDPVLVRVT